MPVSLETRRWRACLGVLLAALPLLAACSPQPSKSTSSDSGTVSNWSFANVRPHLPGASFVNVECPDGRWSPEDSAGKPVNVIDAAGDLTNSISVLEGESRTITEIGNGQKVTLLCVPESFPELVPGWIERWAGMTIIDNTPWPQVIPAFVAGKPVAVRVHEILVDPYGVIRWVDTSIGITSAVEQDPTTSGIIKHRHTTGLENASGPGPWPIENSFATGTPPDDSYVAIYDTPPDASGKAAPTRILKTPYAGLHLDGHDFAALANSNLLVIGYELVKEESLEGRLPSVASRFCALDENAGPYHNLRARIIEYSPKGEVVTIWRAEEHLPALIGPGIRVSTVDIDGKQTCVYDVDHPNALDVDPDGNVLVGMRNYPSAAVLIDWATGDVLWTLGGDAETSLTIEGDTRGAPIAAHDATITRDGNVTYLSFFDNQTAQGVPRYVRYTLETDRKVAVLESEIAATCGDVKCFSIFAGSATPFTSPLSADEVLVNPGGIVGEDITAALGGFLAHYRDGELVSTISLGSWWVYKVSLYAEEPFSRGGPSGP